MTAPDTFVPRPYPEIVRDLLTTLTGGTVRETAVVPAGDIVELRLLADRPIRRVSHLQGEIEVERPVRDANGDVVLDANGDAELETVGVPYRFTDADFELFATGAEGDRHDAIRFRSDGHRPPPGSTVTVNYYPTQTPPVPITDLNVGSVTRTMLEAVGRELAVLELQLEHVYRSAFVETAEGANLDKVVALVGVRRRPVGVATAQLRFTRAAGSTGRITVPVSTVVADADGNRYATVAPLVLEPGEPSRQVLAAAISRSTPAVEAAALDRLEVLVAGVSAVLNESPAAPAAAPESDDELRRRATGALAVAARGTLDALEFGLRSIPGVKDVAITEFPNGVAGEVKVDVAYEHEDPDVEADVSARIEDLRPAGIRVLSGRVGATEVTVTATLTLAGTGLATADEAALRITVEERLAAHIDALAPAATLRQAQAVLAVLADGRIVDAAFEFSIGGAPAASVTAPAGSVLRAVRPFTFTITSERAGDVTGTTIRVDALLPVHLVAGVTAAEAESAITSAASSWLGGLAGGAAVTVDGLVAAVRDDTRYQVLRGEVSVTTTAGDRFLSLADGLGAQPVGATDRVEPGTIAVDVREGGV